jgi:hypothetical protein
MTKHAHSVDKQVWHCIEAQGAGWVFTPSDFADVADKVYPRDVLGGDV